MALRMSMHARRLTGMRAVAARPARWSPARLFSGKPSMAEIKKLRDQTGAPIMDVKKALVATESFDDAVTWLREKGMASAKKKVGRAATEGLVAIATSECSTRSALVELACETDFVARTDRFQELVASVAQIALENSTQAAGVSGLLTLGSVGDEIALAAGTLGENIHVRQVAHVSVDQGVVGWYVHGALCPGAGRIVSAVSLSAKTSDQDALGRFGKQLAMQVTASNPLFLDAAAIPTEHLDKERSVFAAEAEASGKPPEIAVKMAEGKLRKWMSEATFVGQPWMVGDPDGLDEAAMSGGKKKKGGKATVNDMVALWQKHAEGVDSAVPVEVMEFVRLEVGGTGEEATAEE